MPRSPSRISSGFSLLRSGATLLPPLRFLRVAQQLIAKDPHQHERHREQHPAGGCSPQRRPRSPEGIGDEGAGGHGALQPQQQRQRVALQHLAGDHAPVLRHPQLGLALLDRQKQRQQAHREQEPGRGRQHRRHRTGNRPQQKTRGDAEQIQQRHPLELQAVAHLDQPIEQHHPRQGRRYPGSKAQAHHRQHRSRGECGRHAHQPCSDRSMPLAGMGPISRHIQAVVQQVDGAGDQAEGHQRPTGRQPDVCLKAEGEQRRREHQQVLGPLPRAAGCHQGQAGRQGGQQPSISPPRPAWARPYNARLGIVPFAWVGERR